MRFVGGEKWYRNAVFKKAKDWLKSKNITFSQVQGVRQSPCYKYSFDFLKHPKLNFH